MPAKLTVAVQNWESRGQGGNAGRHADRDGEHVVDEEGAACYEARERAKIVLGDDVGATALRIRENRLPIRARDHRDEDADGDPDRNREREGRGARGCQDEQDLLGRVRDGGQGVGREDGKGGSLG
jgi:hypothetical protein